jgi:GMP synthase (glutamine-hydrolysing)
MVRTLRVAVLECDTPIDPVHERYGSYGNRFQTLLETGFKTLGSAVELDVTKWDVVASSGFPDVEQTDALVLTGSSTSTLLHLLGMILILSRAQCL